MMQSTERRILTPVILAATFFAVGLTIVVLPQWQPKNFAEDEKGTCQNKGNSFVCCEMRQSFSINTQFMCMEQSICEQLDSNTGNIKIRSNTMCNAN